MGGNNREVQPMQGREVTCFGCNDDDFEDDDEEDDTNCKNKFFVIREDGTIRPSEDESLCACVEMKNDDVRNKAKVMWGQCDLENEMVNMKWVFNEESEEESDDHEHEHGTISAEISEEFSWTVRNLRRAQNQVVHMTKSRNFDRQMFHFKHGMIWLDHQNDEGQQYCVSFEGEGSKLRTRKCWEPLAGVSDDHDDDHEDHDDHEHGSGDLDSM